MWMRKLTTPAGYMFGKAVLYENLSSLGNVAPVGLRIG
jgi:hypothetical protein